MINIIIIRIIDKTLFSQENQFKYLLCKWILARTAQQQQDHINQSYNQGKWTDKKNHYINIT